MDRTASCLYQRRFVDCPIAYLIGNPFHLSHKLMQTTLDHTTAIKVDVFPNEFKSIMKAIKYATICKDRDALFNPEELANLEQFLDVFSSIALRNAV